MAKIISKKKISFKNQFKLVHFPRLRKDKFIVRPEEMKFVNIMMKKGYKNKYLNDFYRLQQFYKQKIRQICIKEHKTFNLHKASKNVIIYNFSHFFSLLVKKMKLRLELRVFKVRRFERRIPYLVTPWRSFRLGFNLLFKNSKDSLYIFNKDIKVIRLYKLLTEMWETFYGVSLTCKHLLDFTRNVLDNFVHYRSTQLFSIAKHRRQTFFPHKIFYFEKFLYENVIKKVKKIKVRTVTKSEKLKKLIKVKKLKKKHKIRKFAFQNYLKKNLKILKKNLLLVNNKFFIKNLKFELISKKLTKNLKKFVNFKKKKKEKEDLVNFNSFLRKEKREKLRKKNFQKMKELNFKKRMKVFFKKNFHTFLKNSFIYFKKSLNYSKFIEKKKKGLTNELKVKLQKNFSKNFFESINSLFRKLNINKFLVTFFFKKKYNFLKIYKFLKKKKFINKNDILKFLKIKDYKLLTDFEILKIIKSTDNKNLIQMIKIFRLEYFKILNFYKKFSILKKLNLFKKTIFSFNFKSFLKNLNIFKFLKNKKVINLLKKKRIKSSCLNLKKIKYLLKKLNLKKKQISFGMKKFLKLTLNFLTVNYFKLFRKFNINFVLDKKFLKNHFNKKYWFFFRKFFYKEYLTLLKKRRKLFLVNQKKFIDKVLKKKKKLSLKFKGLKPFRRFSRKKFKRFFRSRYRRNKKRNAALSFFEDLNLKKSKSVYIRNNFNDFGFYNNYKKNYIRKSNLNNKSLKLFNPNISYNYYLKQKNFLKKRNIFKIYLREIMMNKIKKHFFEKHFYKKNIKNICTRYNYFFKEKIQKKFYKEFIKQVKRRWLKKKKIKRYNTRDILKRLKFNLKKKNVEKRGFFFTKITDKKHINLMKKIFNYKIKKRKVFVKKNNIPSNILVINNKYKKRSNLNKVFLFLIKNRNRIN